MFMHLHADKEVALASFNELAQTSRTSPLTNLPANKKIQDKEPRDKRTTQTTMVPCQSRLRGKVLFRQVSATRNGHGPKTRMIGSSINKTAYVLNVANRSHLARQGGTIYIDMPTVEEQTTRIMLLCVMIVMSKTYTNDTRKGKLNYMVDEAKRKAALEQIREHITRQGHHVYVVVGAVIPRYAYTIGVSELIGAELILPGASFYGNDDVVEILNDIATQLKRDRKVLRFEVVGQGSFTLRKAHASWTTRFMRGALDYYQVSEIPGLQLVPDHAHWTIDVPDLSVPWSATIEPAWRWLHEPCPYPVSKQALAATNLAAVRGERITEAMRWEEDEWELFAGDGTNVSKDQLRVLALGSLLAMDESLVPVLNLPVGEGLWRNPDPDSAWHRWRKREQTEETAGNGRNK
jgi:hypothetical protein